MPRKSSDKRYLGTDLKPIDVSPKKEKNVVKNNQTAPGSKETPAPASKEAKPEVKPETKPEVPAPAPASVLNLSSLNKEALAKFIDNPRAGLEKYKEAVANGELTEADQADAEPFITILERLAELQDIATQAATVKQPTIDTEEKEMTTATNTAAKETTTTTKTSEVETVNQQQVLPVTNNLTSGDSNNAWAGLVIAAGSALATAGYDTVLESDMSKERIIGALASAAVAVGAQYVIQRTLTNDQSTAVNCAIGAGVGLAAGGLGRFAIGFAREKMNEDVTEL